MEKKDEISQKPGLFSISKSILAAAIGVQNSKNRQRDFEHGNPIVFIIGGVIFTILFVVTVAVIVSVVLSNS